MPPVVTDNCRWVITAETTIFQNVQQSPNRWGIICLCWGFTALSAAKIMSSQSDTKFKSECKTNKKWAASWQNQQCGCAPSEDPDQTGQIGHLPSLIRVFAVRMKKAWVLSYPLSVLRRLWSDWADAQAGLSLRWAHMPLCWFCHEAAQISLKR